MQNDQLEGENYLALLEQFTLYTKHYRRSGLDVFLVTFQGLKNILLQIR
jgi:hypothetical protein